MKLEVLVSSMHEKDFSIVSRSNLDAVATLLVNQCDSMREEMVSEGRHRMLKTSTKGLSVSRNLAIANATADICLLADNDENFVEDLERRVIQAYEEIQDADIIIFQVLNYPNRLGNKRRKLKKIELLRVCSLQISFKTFAIRDRVFFDVNLGAGTGNGASEENKFLLDCYKRGLSIYYDPVEIASLNQSESTWFQGFNEEFFFNRGKTTRYIFGLPFAMLYAVYYLMVKHSMYKNTISAGSAMLAMTKGLLTKDINERYSEAKA